MEILNEPKKLYRSQQRMLGGVCGGMAEYFNIDPTLARVIAVVLFFVPIIPALICYILAWVLIPERK